MQRDTQWNSTFDATLALQFSLCAVGGMSDIYSFFVSY